MSNVANGRTLIISDTILNVFNFLTSIVNYLISFLPNFVTAIDNTNTKTAVAMGRNGNSVKENKLAESAVKSCREQETKYPL